MLSDICTKIAQHQLSATLYLWGAWKGKKVQFHQSILKRQQFSSCDG